MSMPTRNLISSECQQPTFPIEIFQLIIDNLVSANDYHIAAERENLKSCSLVCRTWVPLCQRHIFALVYIGFNYSPDNVPSGQNLITALNESPSLSTHIKTLVYSFRDISHERKYTDPSFSVFLQLRRVRRLQIYSHNQRSSFDEASEHGFGFRPLLTHYLSTGRLTMLQLFGILNLPIHDILATSSLKSLRLFNCSLQSVGEYTPFESSLKFLRVVGVQGLSWSSFRHCSELETLFTQ
ncbi:hypothetical protein BJ165DRAFT_700136 [Panaeolus papilionaceus]|nr:hypothetical protein BJ165DRAFT_700136 [Panaeolus papilionaceus]